MLASLALSDTPLTYRPAKGPKVPLTLAYSQREAYQPKEFHYSNLGPKWNYTGISYIVDAPAIPYKRSCFSSALMSRMAELLTQTVIAMGIGHGDFTERERRVDLFWWCRRL